LRTPARFFAERPRAFVRVFFFFIRFHLRQSTMSVKTCEALQIRTGGAGPPARASLHTIFGAKRRFVFA
jgi:hypothetical protein